MENLSAGMIEFAVERYSDMLFRICFVALGSREDAEDAVQDVFLKYVEKTPDFETEEHEKAWLIRVAINRCRDIKRKRHVQVDLTSLEEYIGSSDDNDALNALMSLPDKYRTVLTLKYMNGYNVQEIARIVGLTASTVKMRLKRGREIFREEYEA